MGYLIEGKWTEEDPPETGQSGQFQRIASSFRNRITRDGSSGFPAEVGRYHLYVGYHCPWAHRTILYRALKGLEDAISISYCLPTFQENGWIYEERDECPDCTVDQINGFRYLWQAYALSDPSYTGKVTIPVLWDKQTNKVVNNESSEIIRMLNSEFIGVAGNDVDFYPEAKRAEIDELNELIYATVNNGAYRCGFARSQEAYEEAYDSLFATLDKLEDRLSRQRYLTGDKPTEADWRLLPTLLRFDVAYFSLFKCNRQQLRDFRNLWNYTLDLYSIPKVAGTVKPRIYVQNYFSLRRANQWGVIPKGTPVNFDQPHDRARFG